VAPIRTSTRPRSTAAATAAGWSGAAGGTATLRGS
jgi:hypothetical protein